MSVRSECECVSVRMGWGVWECEGRVWECEVGVWECVCEDGVESVGVWECESVGVWSVRV